jgi:aryl sulfotransferase
MPHSTPLPPAEPPRVYQNHHLDSTRWRYFAHRPGDIVVSTSYKAGTTWMQTIVANLLHPHGELPMPATHMSPWLDCRFFPLELALNLLGGQTSRRCVKTHLPLDGLPYYEDAQYVVVARDARDVFMSLLNHWGHHTREFHAMLDSIPGRVGDPFPVFDGDVPRRFQEWMTRGWFEWESDGYPYWSHLHHCKTWWEVRQLPNVRLVHYDDLLADLEGEMRGLAAWLGIEVPEERWPQVVDACRFETVKRDPEKVVGDMSWGFRGGAQTFIHKGTNGRWRGVLSDDDLALYEAAAKRTLAPDCARWLEGGKAAAG